MVKIEIDDAVRAYALDYSQRVMATCADVEKKLAELNAALETAATDYQELLRLTEEKEREEAALEALMTQWAEVSAALEQD